MAWIAKTDQRIAKIKDRCNEKGVCKFFARGNCSFGNNCFAPHMIYDTKASLNAYNPITRVFTSKTAPVDAQAQSRSVTPSVTPSVNPSVTSSVNPLVTPSVPSMSLSIGLSGTKRKYTASPDDDTQRVTTQRPTERSLGVTNTAVMVHHPSTCLPVEAPGNTTSGGVPLITPMVGATSTKTVAPTIVAATLSKSDDTKGQIKVVWLKLKAWIERECKEVLDQYWQSPLFARVVDLYRSTYISTPTPTTPSGFMVKFDYETEGKRLAQEIIACLLIDSASGLLFSSFVNLANRKTRPKIKDNITKHTVEIITKEMLTRIKAIINPNPLDPFRVENSNTSGASNAKNTSNTAVSSSSSAANTSAAAPTTSIDPSTTLVSLSMALQKEQLVPQNPGALATQLTLRQREAELERESELEHECEIERESELDHACEIELEKQRARELQEAEEEEEQEQKRQTILLRPHQHQPLQPSQTQSGTTPSLATTTEATTIPKFASRLPLLCPLPTQLDARDGAIVKPILWEMVIKGEFDLLIHELLLARSALVQTLAKP